MEIKARNHLDGVWLEEPYYNFVFETPKGSSAAHAGMSLNPVVLAAAIATGVMVFSPYWKKAALQ